jgi:RNA polymerase sigma factor (sigma-70 family)
MNLKDVLKDLEFWQAPRNQPEKLKKLQSAIQAQLIGYAKNKCGLNYEDACDVVQNLFVTILRNPPTNTDNIMGWLVTIIRNDAIRVHNRRNRQNKLAEELRLHHEEKKRVGELQEQVEDARGPLAECIERLTQVQRQLIIERYFGGLQLQEIANQLKHVSSSLGYHCQLALKSLKRCLKSKGVIWGIDEMTR